MPFKLFEFLEGRMICAFLITLIQLEKTGSTGCGSQPSALVNQLTRCCLPDFTEGSETPGFDSQNGGKLPNQPPYEYKPSFGHSAL